MLEAGGVKGGGVRVLAVLLAIAAAAAVVSGSAPSRSAAADRASESQGPPEEYGESLPDPGTPRIRGRILAVIDGDTIRILTDRGGRLTVRLIGLDAPRLRPLECGARSAKRSLRRLSLRGSRRLSVVHNSSRPRRDRSGRLLAYARTATGRDLGEHQIRAGWAVVRASHGRIRRSRVYTNREAEARDALRGLWGRCGGDPHRRVSP